MLQDEAEASVCVKSVSGFASSDTSDSHVQTHSGNPAE